MFKNCLHYLKKLWLNITLFTKIKFSTFPLEDNQPALITSYYYFINHFSYFLFFVFNQLFYCFSTLSTVPIISNNNINLKYST